MTRIHPEDHAANVAKLAGEAEEEVSPRVWPVLAPAALYGRAGELIRTIEPTTEADPVAILVYLIVMLGNAVNRSAYFTVESTRHHLNLFALIIGLTSKGRKGTAENRARRLMTYADADWVRTRIWPGLSSGEGLIAAVHDESGDADKRLMVNESEFASVLRVAKRDGNTLSSNLRQAWDGGPLRSMVKNSPLRATDHHISVLGAITADELRREITSTDAQNGFLNRFLHVCAKRSRCLPDGGSLAPDVEERLGRILERAVQTGRSAGEMLRNPEARDLWYAVYEELSAGRPGLLGAALGRAEAQVTRLACLYAILDGSDVVREPHLRAALALWDYCAASAAYIYGSSIGVPLADKILALLSAHRRMPRTDIHDALGRHVKAAELELAIGTLIELGLVRPEEEPTAGRPRKVLTLSSDNSHSVRSSRGLKSDSEIREERCIEQSEHPEATPTDCEETEEREERSDADTPPPPLEPGYWENLQPPEEVAA